MKRFISLIVVVMMLFVSMETLAGSAGNKGAVFLKLGQGARANAMGESFVAVADDINALYWNPAGIASIKEHQCTFMYSDWLEEIKYNYLAYVHPAQIMGGIMGGAVTLLNSGDIDGRDKASLRHKWRSYKGKVELTLFFKAEEKLRSLEEME